jgi:nucleotide-binding universal stress UspA family protein
MYHAVLVPLDGSARGEQALSLACSVARRNGAQLHLVHVHVPVKPPGVEAMPALNGTVDAANRVREGVYLASIVRRLQTNDQVTAIATALDGSIADELQRYSVASGIDLIVMGTHGRGGLSRFWLGSVTDRLVRWGHVPMLLVRPHEPAPIVVPERVFHHVLVPLDGSALAEQGLADALALGTPEQTAYTLLHVIEVETGDRGTECYAIALDEPALAQVRTRTQRYLERVAARIRADGWRVQTAVESGRAAPAILQYATMQTADLIAITARGQSGSANMLGGVADKVVRGASVPVLLCWPNQQP